MLSSIKAKEETEQRLLLGKILFNLEMERQTEQGKCIYKYKIGDLILQISWNKEHVFYIFIVNIVNFLTGSSTSSTNIKHQEEASYHKLKVSFRNIHSKSNLTYEKEK